MQTPSSKHPINRHRHLNWRSGKTHAIAALPEMMLASQGCRFAVSSFVVVTYLLLLMVDCSILFAVLDILGPLGMRPRVVVQEAVVSGVADVDTVLI